MGVSAWFGTRVADAFSSLTSSVTTEKARAGQRRRWWKSRRPPHDGHERSRCGLYGDDYGAHRMCASNMTFASGCVSWSRFRVRLLAEVATSIQNLRNSIAFREPGGSFGPATRTVRRGARSRNRFGHGRGCRVCGLGSLWPVGVFPVSTASCNFEVRSLPV